MYTILSGIRFCTWVCRSCLSPPRLRTEESAFTASLIGAMLKMLMLWLEWIWTKITQRQHVRSNVTVVWWRTTRVNRRYTSHVSVFHTFVTLMFFLICSFSDSVEEVCSSLREARYGWSHTDLSGCAGMKCRCGCDSGPWFDLVMLPSIIPSRGGILVT